MEGTIIMLDLTNRINSKEQLSNILKYEKEVYNAGGIKYYFQISEKDILYKHQVLLRKTEYYLNSGKKALYVLYKFRLQRMQNKYALHIPLNCCDRGLKIMHLGPVLMNGQVTVGKDCVFHMNTALVANGVSDEAPVLADRVVVGIGAIVLGGVYIAKNVAIGANAVVTKDVLEENIAVAGVPAKKISDNGRLEWNKK